MPAQPFELDPELFCKNVRSARRGAAPGPSGMTVEHLLGLVDSSDHDMEVFASFAGLVSRGLSPEAFWKGSDLSRHSPSKAGWWDSRNHCGRHYSQIDRPHNCPADLQTSRGGNSPASVRVADEVRIELVSHMVQMLTELNPRQTVVSVDGVGAFDLVTKVGQHDRWRASLPFRAILLL